MSDQDRFEFEITSQQEEEWLADQEEQRIYQLWLDVVNQLNERNEYETI